MNSKNKNAGIAGILYLLIAITGEFSIILWFLIKGVKEH